MYPVGMQSIWTVWKSSARLADGREIVYFDEAPGLGRDQVRGHPAAAAADAGTRAAVRPAGMGGPLGRS